MNHPNQERCACNLIPPRGVHAESCVNYTQNHSIMDGVEETVEEARYEFLTWMRKEYDETGGEIGEMDFADKLEEILRSIVAKERESAERMVMEALEVSYSEHFEYTDETLRYHEKQRKIIAEVFARKDKHLEG